MKEELGKSLLKSLKSVEAEIGGEGSLPTDWISTGNYCINKLLSGELDKGIAVGRISVFAGPSGVGKSLLIANIIREAGKKGFFTIIFDSESALDKNFLENLGVDIKNTAYLQVDTLERFRNKAVEILQSITDEKILIVLDSFGNLSTEKELGDALIGKNASDMGCLTADSKIITIDGTKPVAEVAVGDKVLTHLNTFEDVVDAVSHECSSEYDKYEVTLEDGETITMTHDHKLLVDRNGNLDWIRADELKDSDMVMRIRG